MTAFQALVRNILDMRTPSPDTLTEAQVEVAKLHTRIRRLENLLARTMLEKKEAEQRLTQLLDPPE